MARHNGAMSDVTRILSQIESGDPQAAEQLLPLVYDELRKLAAAKLAQEKPGQTLQATALVHEAYLRLVDTEQAANWNSRGHFFGAAAEAMRRVLIDRARDKKRVKRNSGRQCLNDPKSAQIGAVAKSAIRSTNHGICRCFKKTSGPIRRPMLYPIERWVRDFAAANCGR